MTKISTDPYELCDEAVERWNKTQIFLSHFYWAKLYLLLQILYSYAFYYLVEYLGASELIAAFAYPFVICLVLIFLLVFYAWYTHRDSLFLRILVGGLSMLLMMTFGNFIQECLDSTFTPGTALHLAFCFVVAIALSIEFICGWFLGKKWQDTHIHRLQVLHIRAYHPHIQEKDIDHRRIHYRIDRLSHQHDKEQGIESILTIPVSDSDSTYHELHQMLTTSFGSR